MSQKLYSEIKGTYAFAKAKDYLGENVAGAIDWTGTAVRGLINNYVGTNS